MRPYPRCEGKSSLRSNLLWTTAALCSLRSSVAPKQEKRGSIWTRSHAVFSCGVVHRIPALKRRAPFPGVWGRAPPIHTKRAPRVGLGGHVRRCAQDPSVLRHSWRVSRGMPFPGAKIRLFSETSKFFRRKILHTPRKRCFNGVRAAHRPVARRPVLTPLIPPPTWYSGGRWYSSHPVVP